MNFGWMGGGRELANGRRCGAASLSLLQDAEDGTLEACAPPMPLDGLCREAGERPHLAGSSRHLAGNVSAAVAAGESVEWLLMLASVNVEEPSRLLVAWTKLRVAQRDRIGGLSAHHSTIKTSIFICHPASRTQPHMMAPKAGMTANNPPKMGRRDARWNPALRVLREGQSGS